MFTSPTATSIAQAYTLSVLRHDLDKKIEGVNKAMREIKAQTHDAMTMVGIQMSELNVSFRPIERGDLLLVVNGVDSNVVLRQVNDGSDGYYFQIVLRQHVSNTR